MTVGMAVDSSISEISAHTLLGSSMLELPPAASLRAQSLSVMRHSAFVGVAEVRLLQ
jgi:hypothetical protein